MQTPSHDLIVFGATGFVGQILTRYLAEQFGTHGRLKWAIAGRSETKLDALRNPLGPSAGKLSIVVADAGDATALRRMCVSTRAVASTVGPYALHDNRIKLPQHQAQTPSRQRARGGRLSRPHRALLCLLLLTTMSTPYPTVTAVAQRGLSGRISRVIPFAGVLVGWKHRNRVYRNAEEFIRDRNRYYDSLRDTARQQLVQREQLGLRTSQVAAYTRVVALIEQQRKTELDVAEARTDGAYELVPQARLVEAEELAPHRRPLVADEVDRVPLSRHELPTVAFLPVGAGWCFPPMVGEISLTQARKMGQSLNMGAFCGGSNRSAGSLK